MCTANDLRGPLGEPQFSGGESKRAAAVHTYADVHTHLHGCRHGGLEGSVRVGPEEGCSTQTFSSASPAWCKSRAPTVAALVRAAVVAIFPPSILNTWGVTLTTIEDLSSGQTEVLSPHLVTQQIWCGSSLRTFSPTHQIWKEFLLKREPGTSDIPVRNTRPGSEETYIQTTYTTPFTLFPREVRRFVAVNI